MQKMIRLTLTLALTVVASTVLRSQATPVDPHPKTVEEFKAAVQKVLDDTRVPGAGIALVRLNGVEWAGGIGYADRDARTPVTAVAMASEPSYDLPTMPDLPLCQSAVTC